MDRPWHALAVGEVIEALATDSSAGLTHEDAADRLQEHGPNELVSCGGDGIPGRLLAQFGDVLIWVLLAAAAISGVDRSPGDPHHRGPERSCSSSAG